MLPVTLCVMFCICYVHPVIGAGFELLRIAMFRFLLMCILPFKFNVAFIMCILILLCGAKSSYTVNRAMADKLIDCPAETVSCDMCLKLYNISTLCTASSNAFSKLSLVVYA